MATNPSRKPPGEAKSQQKIPHLLMVNLGLGQAKYGPLGYALASYVMPDGCAYSTALAGFALWKWLEETGRSPRAVVFACTKDAWSQREQAVKEHAKALGLNPGKIHDPVFLVLPQTLDHVWAMVEALQSWVKGAAKSTPVLHVDLTHAYRAIPLAHLLIVLYLQERGLVQVGVCGYGAYEEGRAQHPYLDLSHLLHLARWAQAVRAFRDRFDTAGLAALLEGYEKGAQREIAQGGLPPPPQVRQVIEAARHAGPYFAAGLPLELGISIRQRLRDTSKEVLDKAAQQLIFAQRDLVLELFDFLSPLAPSKVEKRAPKTSITLSPEEISRQVHLASLLLKAGLPERALLVLRELVISRVLLTWRPERWLEREVRERAEEALNALPENEKPGSLSHQLRALRSAWHRLRNLRNPLAHAGMQRDKVRWPNLCEKVEALIKDIKTLVKAERPWKELVQRATLSKDDAP